MSIKDIISPFNGWKRALEKPDTITKPLTDREGAKVYRGFHKNDIDKCIGCGSCEDICQNGAIDLVELLEKNPDKGDSGLRPKVDYGRCCWCALCIDVCPTNSLTMSNDYTWVTDDADEYLFIPGKDEKKWNDADKGYRKNEDSWLVNPERIGMTEVEPEVRKNTFDEFALGYSEEEALVEASRCLECGLCVETCPTHMDIPEYIRTIREGDLEEGLRIMYKTNPFVEACGRICTAKCETACAIGNEGKPVAIKYLKRYIADNTFKDKERILGLSKEKSSGKTVAVIGGGPAGLTAAFYLTNYGHKVTVFEKLDKLGGMLKYGIPDYRLPADVLQREIDYILNRGVEVKYNTSIGKDIQLENLKKDYDAVFISIGAQLGTQLRTEGENSEGVYSGVDFLQKLAKGTQPDLGKRVVVVGGGNTAMDACRSSIRLGAEVTVVYRRSEKEMPANREEIVEAKEEGAILEVLSNPVKIERKDNHLFITCIRMRLGEPDKSGRRSPIPIEGSEYVIEADSLIMAVGQKVDTNLGKGPDVEKTKWNTFNVDQDSLVSNIDGIFSGGDCETGPDDAIRAIASGKKVAYSINNYLSGK